MPSLEFRRVLDRKSTRLNSSHTIISYAVFCLKKKIRIQRPMFSARSTPPCSVRRRSPPPHVRGAVGRGLRAERASGTFRQFVLSFFFIDPAPPGVSPLPLHAALPV